jgi:drug/metabolite transporter (DMT)-like permease
LQAPFSFLAGKATHRWRGFAMAITGAVMFSTKAIFIKLAYTGTGVDAVSLLFLRMLLALPVYLVIAVWALHQSKVLLTSRQMVYIVVLGLLGYYLSSLFDFLGLQYISAGLERLILFLYPTFAVLINSRLFGQKPSRLQVRALVLTYFGIGLAFISELSLDAPAAGIIKGSIWVLLCAVTFSGYIVGTGRLVQQINSQLFTALAMLAATLGIVLHFALAGNYQVLVQPQAAIWGYGLLLALIATVIPSFLMTSGMQRIGTNNTAIVMAIGPVATILQAYLFLGEKITWLQVVGTLLVIAGVAQLGQKAKAAV